ncbi:biotin synthase BioB [Desulfotomaculum copahuensis]|uniref:Biotin synthase n=1 Tax=Desulfotomaculum copahuensis TaxID=1838280 RepID=A0A1B7LGF6_9FIRM|nr:biotin synthase BioB [Desulfotomaculum copahuensis]OAT85016.1 biotin synthase BioB [Desulfotomaculum copahuensis]
MNLSRALIEAKVFSGEGLSREEILSLAGCAGEELVRVRALAGEVTRRFHGRRVDLCSIINARSGLCSEDCRFCAQSARYRTGAAVYPLIDAAAALAKARRMEAAGAGRFSLVTSGRGITGRDFETVLDVFRILHAETGLSLCASLGIIDGEQARQLKEAGVSTYHHNLETGRSFFPQICTTHSYDERVATIRAAQGAGLAVCSGGIIGMGESLAQRMEMALEIRKLGVNSVPLNVLNPIPGTPLANAKPLSPEEILKTIALFRLVLPRATVRLCGGREPGLGERQAEAFQYGINGLMVGNYLTTRGDGMERDLAMLAAAGLAPRAACGVPGTGTVDPE